MKKIDSLFLQIDAFIKKYYKNLMLKGALIFVSFFLFVFLFITLSEYYFHFSSFFRSILFFGFLLLNFSILIYFFINPLLKILSVGKKISRNKAASMIGKLIPGIDDKLLNTIQLYNTQKENDFALEIISASIEKRSEKLHFFSFKKAISFKENVKYLKVFFPLFLIFSVLFLFFPSWLLTGSERIFNYSKEYLPPTPFQFNLLNKNLVCDEGEDYVVHLKVTGKELPS